MSDLMPLDEHVCDDCGRPFPEHSVQAGTRAPEPDPTAHFKGVPFVGLICPEVTDAPTQEG